VAARCADWLRAGAPPLGPEAVLKPPELTLVIGEAGRERAGAADTRDALAGVADGANLPEPGRIDDHISKHTHAHTHTHSRTAKRAYQQS
jgi:hypothetical protein